MLGMGIGLGRVKCMVMSNIWTGLVGISIVCAVILGRGSSLSGAAIQGAQNGVTLGISLAGAICLWSGVGRLMEAAGVSKLLARILQPVLGRVFPGTRRDSELAGALSANVCANFLGLGNAATPPGILAAKKLSGAEGIATDELCRLVVLNTASIQLIPATVGAVRSGLGCRTPFDILPAVWITSFCSASLGLGAAWVLGKVWQD